MNLKVWIILSCLVFILGYGIYQYFAIYDGRLHVVFCDVGQGDAIYIRTPNGTDIVIDAGRDDSILTCLSNNMPFWDKTIELAFATHPDADHISGFVHILESYTVRSYNSVNVKKDTGVFERIHELLSEKKVTVRSITFGDVYRLSDGTTLKTYWPTKEFIQKGDSDTNRYSLVQILKYGEFDTLLTGDIEFDILNSIISSGVDIDILKLPHHGSKTGVDSNTFTFIKPQLSIISAGKNNSYGHPHRQVLEELKKFKLRYLRTDEVGEIEIVSSGQGFVVR